MHFYELLTVVYFGAFTGLAWLRSLDRRLIVTAFGLGGISAICLTVYVLPGYTALQVVRDWLPVALLPMAYWQTGQFDRPLNKKLQDRLWEFDRKVLQWLPGLSKPGSSRWVASWLELAYLLCYPFVPSGLAVLYWMGLDRFAAEFWNVVLLPAFLCYGTFPFVQTLPPRAIDAGPVETGSSKIRGLNLVVLQHLSVQANTFPSGHVAASLAVSLELIRHAPLIGLMFLLVAFGISAGAFVGRYHFALDVLIGAALAVVGFALSLL